MNSGTDFAMVMILIMPHVCRQPTTAQTLESHTPLRGGRSASVEYSPVPRDPLHTAENGLNYGAKKSRRSPQQTLTSCSCRRRRATAGKPATPNFRPPRRGDAPGPLKLTSGSFYGPGSGLPVDSVPGPAFEQSRDTGPDPAGSQLVILFRRDSGDQGTGCVGVPGDYPGCDGLDGVLLFRVVYEISLTPGIGGVYQLAYNDVYGTVCRPVATRPFLENCRSSSTSPPPLFCVSMIVDILRRESQSRWWCPCRMSA